MEEEIWKDIPGYEGYYQASNLGRIKSLERVTRTKVKVKGKILTQRYRRGNERKQGYLAVILSVDGKPKTESVHRLVAKAFIANPNNLPEVNHKDENKSNNRLENLEWCDRKYNANYGTLKERRKLCKSKPVNMYDKDNIFIRRFDSLSDAAKYVNGSMSRIASCCRGVDYCGKRINVFAYGHFWSWCGGYLTSKNGYSYIEGKIARR